MSAIELYARPSGDFDAKLVETKALLHTAARDYAAESLVGPALITQASSLGAEDMVVSHLINLLALDIPIFVLETGMLHAETLQLLEQSFEMDGSLRDHARNDRDLDGLRQKLEKI